MGVGSIRFDGVRFVAYPQDHAPRHVHGFYAETEVIVDLLPGARREVAKANRRDAVRPGRAKRSDVRYILRVAAAHFDELAQLWEEAHA
jgi:hypothetical protein